MEPEWHLINGVTGRMECKFVDEQRGREWLAKQLKEFPNGYYKEMRSRIDRYPPLPEVCEQLDIFEIMRSETA